MSPRWVLVLRAEELRPDDQLRAKGYDDQEVARMGAAEIERLISLRALWRRARST